MLHCSRHTSQHWATVSSLLTVGVPVHVTRASYVSERCTYQSTSASSKAAARIESSSLWTVFAVQCYASALPMPSCSVCVPVCLCVCVCPSVSFVDCVKTGNYIVGLFSPSGRPIILFSIPNRMVVFRWGPHNRGVDWKVVMKKITIFDQYLALSPKWCKIEP